MTLDKTLLQIFHSGKFTHSWLIGTDDEAKALREVMVFAQGILKGHHLPIENNPNFYIVRRQNNTTGDLAKHITVDQIRKLQSFLSTKNAEGQYKISVIYQADLMNANAANCCLKLLEEPGANNFIFLITVSSHQILPTIRSRCQKLWVRNDIRCHTRDGGSSDKQHTQEDKILDPSLHGNDSAVELLSYINDHQLFINKLSAKIEKEFVCAMGRSAMEIVGRELKTSSCHSSYGWNPDKQHMQEEKILDPRLHGDDAAHNPHDLLCKFDQINKIVNNLVAFDLDPKVSFIMLVEAMSYQK